MEAATYKHQSCLYWSLSEQFKTINCYLLQQIWHKSDWLPRERWIVGWLLHYCVIDEDIIPSSSTNNYKQHYLFFSMPLITLGIKHHTLAWWGMSSLLQFDNQASLFFSNVLMPVEVSNLHTLNDHKYLLYSFHYVFSDNKLYPLENPETGWPVHVM